MGEAGGACFGDGHSLGERWRPVIQTLMPVPFQSCGEVGCVWTAYTGGVDFVDMQPRCSMTTREQSDSQTCICGLCPVHTTDITGREAKVYEAVKDGRLTIDEFGRVWRGDARADYQKGTLLRITLRVDGRITSTLAHRLVWFHFYGSIPPGLLVLPIDGDGFNNSPSNLALATPSENGLHRYHNLGHRNLRP